MTQERLMERLWLLLQPYGWELRKGHLYREIEIEDYGWREVSPCRRKMTKTYHIIFKIAFKLIEVTSNEFIRHLSCEVTPLVLDAIEIPIGHIAISRNSRVGVGTIEWILRDIEDDIVNSFEREDKKHMCPQGLHHALFKGIDQDTLEFDIFQEEGDLEL